MLIVSALPPNVNHAVRHTRDGRHYKTKAAEDFDWQVALEWRKHDRGTIEAEHYAVDIMFQLKAGRKGRQPDLDGLCKYALDALVHCNIILDDVRVTDLSLHKQQSDCDQTIYTIIALDKGSTEDHPVPMQHFDFVEPAF